MKSKRWLRWLWFVIIVIAAIYTLVYVSVRRSDVRESTLPKIERIKQRTHEQSIKRLIQAERWLRWLWFVIIVIAAIYTLVYVSVRHSDVRESTLGSCLIEDIMVNYTIYHENTSVNYSFEYNASHYPVNYNNYSLEDRNQFILPVWRQVLWSILYAGMVIVATGGNLIVIWIVLAHKRMRTVTNYFLLNLSVADTMVSTLNVTFNYVYMLYSHWPFGELYCKISQFIAVLSVCASVFSLMSISIDRYMAIMTPLKPRMGRMVTLVLALFTWIFGIIIGMPSLLFYKTYRDRYSNGEERVICYSEWPDGMSSESLYEYYFNVAFLVITYLVPILSMTYTYARIGIELWGSQSIGECTQRQMDNIKSKRRVVKMMMVVVIIFAVCWLPYQLYFIIISYFPDITKSEYIQETFLAIYWLAMSNSMYNPIIYCWMNARFRRGFKQFFSCLPFVHVSPGALTRREVLTSKRRSYSGSPDHNRIIRNGTVRISYNPHTTVGGRPSPSSSTNTCYSQVPEDIMARRCEMRQLS